MARGNSKNFWDEATALIAAELKRITEKYGREAIYYNYQSGAYYQTQGSPAWKRLLNITAWLFALP